MHLSLDAVRTLLVAAQGLDKRPAHTPTKADLRAIIRHMHVLQIDTINIVARSPYLVLWSRLGHYNPQWLDELLAEGAIFEYWSHAACFLPIEDYPLYRSIMLDETSNMTKYANTWLEAHREFADTLLEQIRRNGETRSSDYKRTDGEKGTWWNWKIEKQALEVLFLSGDLMIARRHHFQRIYDLRERVLPGWDDTQAPSRDRVRRMFVLNTVRALGATPARWIADYFRTKQAPTLKALAELVAEGALLEATVEGWPQPVYIHPENAALAEAAAAGSIKPELSTLLSPFDPLVWDRARALALFGFDYQIECYTPAPKRRYGYFTLPILHRGQLVGRLDPKAHRKEQRFEVKALHLEPGLPITDELVAGIASALRDCATWHATPEIDIRWSDPPELAALVQKAVS